MAETDCGADYAILSVISTAFPGKYPERPGYRLVLSPIRAALNCGVIRSACLQAGD
jgi:hypothetical protein